MHVRTELVKYDQSKSVISSDIMELISFMETIGMTKID